MNQYMDNISSELKFSNESHCYAEGESKDSTLFLDGNGRFGTINPVSCMRQRTEALFSSELLTNVTPKRHVFPMFFQ